MTQAQICIDAAMPGEAQAIAFTKMHGIGNDFIIIDGFQQQLPADVEWLSRAAPRWCDRRTGIGADGILFLQPTADADAEMLVINADGSSAQMCGNGLRCVCKYLVERSIVSAMPMRIRTGAGVLAVHYQLNRGQVENVTVDMGAPILAASRIPVQLPRSDADAHIVDAPLEEYIALQHAQWMHECELDMHMTAVSMGNPHMVIFCGFVGSVPLEMIGPYLEHQPIFPERINVHFVQVISRSEIRMRTWERGSGITQACGTGACAVCVAGSLTRRTERKVEVHLPGGDLQLQWDPQTKHVLMTGPAEEICTGIIPRP